MVSGSSSASCMSRWLCSVVGQSEAFLLLTCLFSSFLPVAFLASVFALSLFSWDVLSRVPSTEALADQARRRRSKNR